jgi:UDP-glucose 4-epimerase
MNNRNTFQDEFGSKAVLITGGLGFIGSNLAIRLVGLGAQVHILDAMYEQHGGNIYNIDEVKNKVTVNYCDIRDSNALRCLVPGHDFVFHLAGQNDHVLSLKDPFPDIYINIVGSAKLLEACRLYNPQVKLVYTGTRGEYGSNVSLPVSEEAPLNPKGIYELSSMTAQKLFKIYNDNQRLRSITLRLTNVYGPRSQMKHDRFGVVNWFVRQAIDGETIRVFGDGSIKRDFLYVDDAVDAILMCAASSEAYGQTFNVGRDVPTTFLELAQMIVRLARSGSWKHADFTPERAAQEPGHYFSDISKIRSAVGWSPRVSLEDGLTRTIQFYRTHREHYWS